MVHHRGRTWLGAIAIAASVTWLVACQEKARGPGTASTRPNETAPLAEAPPTATTPKPADAAPRQEPSQQEPPSPLTAQPVPRSQTEAAPEVTPTPVVQPRVVEARKPKRPITVSWVRFREALVAEKDVSCEATWTGGNRLEVHTTNIQRLTLDLTKLPEGAPRKGPWNLQIDGQGIEITGFRPKEGYTGKIRDLVCSPNGLWTVDRKALYRGPR